MTKDHKGKEGKGQGHKETVRSGLGYYGCGLFAEHAYLTENAQNGGGQNRKKREENSEKTREEAGGEVRRKGTPHGSSVGPVVVRNCSVNIVR